MLAVVVAIALVVALLASGDGEGSPARLPAPAISFESGPSLQSATVWAVGDGADGSEAARQVVDVITEDEVDRFLYLGDVYESGTASEFMRNYAPVYGELQNVTSPTPGNHEWPLHAQGYDLYWSGNAGGPTPHYYAFELAGWEILSLNSEGPHGPGSPQLRWLDSRLSEPGDCRLAFWHFPRFSAGPHGDSTSVAPLWDAVVGKARIVLTGHEHDYQRFAPIDGVTQLVVGSGGHGHYQVDSSDPRLRFANDSDYGALRLRLTPGGASFEFITAEGLTLDRGSVTCQEG